VHLYHVREALYLAGGCARRFANVQAAQIWNLLISSKNNPSYKAAWFFFTVAIWFLSPLSHPYVHVVSSYISSLCQHLDFSPQSALDAIVDPKYCRTPIISS
jgi:hypothetical protein